MKALSDPEKEALFALSYRQFDQDPKGGWRVLQDEIPDQDIGEIIDAYRERHQSLETWQTGILFWHAGQVYAGGENYPLARQRFMASLSLTEPPDYRWNEYVHATVAFIDGDLVQLERHRERLALQPNSDADKNLAVVNSLVRHFGRPYRVAYDLS